MWVSGDGPLALVLIFFFTNQATFPGPYSSVVPVLLVQNVLEPRFWLFREPLFPGHLFWFTLECPGILLSLFSSLTPSSSLS